MRNLDRYGIKVYPKLNIEEIRRNPPTSNFVVFNLSNSVDSEKFHNEILKNEEKLETLPYRLFIKFPDDNQIKYEIEKDEILSKRLCVIDEKEFNEMKNYLGVGKPIEAVVYLYCLWLKHLTKINGYKDSEIKFTICIYKAAEETEATIIPKEVFDKYQVLESFFSESKSRGSDNQVVKVSCKNLQIEVKETSKGASSCANAIVYHRHHINEINKFSYYESFSADSISFPLYFWWPDEENERKLRACLLLENALLSLVVIDERICKAISIGRDHGEKGRMFFIGKFSGDNNVEIANEPLFSVKARENTCDLEIKNKYELKEPAILIVHQGILDKAFNDKSKEKLKDKVKTLKKKFPFFIITSGRGKPENTPDNAKFLLLSDIMINFRRNEYPDKLGIINLIMNLTGGK